MVIHRKMESSDLLKNIERNNKKYYESVIENIHLVKSELIVEIRKQKVNIDNIDYLKQQNQEISKLLKELNKPLLLEKEILKELKVQNRKIEYLYKQFERMFGLNGFEE